MYASFCLIPAPVDADQAIIKKFEAEYAKSQETLSNELKKNRTDTYAAVEATKQAGYKLSALTGYGHIPETAIKYYTEKIQTSRTAICEYTPSDQKMHAELTLQMNALRNKMNPYERRKSNAEFAVTRMRQATEQLKKIHQNDDNDAKELVASLDHCKVVEKALSDTGKGLETKKKTQKTEHTALFETYSRAHSKIMHHGFRDCYAPQYAKSNEETNKEKTNDDAISAQLEPPYKKAKTDLAAELRKNPPAY